MSDVLPEPVNISLSKCRETDRDISKTERSTTALFRLSSRRRKVTAWQFHLDPVYCIGIVDFSFSENGDYFSRIQLQNEKTNEVFFDKLTYIFLELPKFNLSLSELLTPRDKWMYFFKHLAELDEIPAEFTGAISNPSV